MRKLICSLLILSLISALALAQAIPGQTEQKETIESLRQALREAEYKAERRNPEHAVFWSIIPGGGQVYNGEYIKAVLAYGGVLISALAAWGNGSYAWLPLTVWTYTAYEARQSAINYNNNLKKKYGLSSIKLKDLASL